MSPSWPGGPGRWSAKTPERVALHCVCGLSFDADVRSGAKAITAAWAQVHCGEGHGYSPVHVERPTEAETLEAYRQDIESGGDV